MGTCLQITYILLLIISAGTDFNIYFDFQGYVVRGCTSASARREGQAAQPILQIVFC